MEVFAELCITSQHWSQKCQNLSRVTHLDHMNKTSTALTSGEHEQSGEEIGATDPTMPLISDPTY